MSEPTDPTSVSRPGEPDEPTVASFLPVDDGEATRAMEPFAEDTTPPSGPPPEPPEGGGPGGGEEPPPPDNRQTKIVVGVAIAVIVLLLGGTAALLIARRDSGSSTTTTTTSSTTTSTTTSSTTTTTSSTTTSTTTTTTTTTTTVPTGPVDVTSSGVVQASTAAAGHPAKLGIDGDVTTSWMGPGAPGSDWVYTWSIATDQLIDSVKIVGNGSNSDHSLRTGHGFDSVTVEVLTHNNSVVFSQTFGLPGSPDPTRTVRTNKVGSRVRLTFAGAEDPTLSGFAELTVIAIE